MAASAACSIKRGAVVLAALALLLSVFSCCLAKAVTTKHTNSEGFCLAKGGDITQLTLTADSDLEYDYIEQSKSMQQIGTGIPVARHAENDAGGVDDGDIILDESFGVKQRIEGAEAPITRELIQDTIRYMKEEVFAKTKYAKVRDLCKNKHGLCAFWAATGQCSESKSYMQYSCAPSCKTCHLIDYETRCPPGDRNAKDDLQPGGLSLLMKRIIDPESYLAKFRPKVHSGPAPRDGEAIAPGKENFQVGPLVVTFDSFLTEEECDRLVALGYEEGFGPNNVGYDDQDPQDLVPGENAEHIKSEVAFCRDSCEEDATTKAIIARMSNVTGLPVNNTEEMQILKYEVGQYIGSHWDGGDFEVSRPCGPTIMTFFLYLSDVAKGGETYFQHLNGLTITPKRGKAVLWSNVIDTNLHVQDRRAMHESLPVRQGVKLGANVFIHLRDFLTPREDGCC